MAYDANDKADKKIVDDLIRAALEKQKADLVEEHEADVSGLKTKNTELLAKLKKAREGQSDPDAVAKLEGDLEKSQADLKTAQKELKAAVKDRDTFKTTAEAETNAARKLLVDQGLTEALTENKVGSQFIPAVRKLLEGQVTIKTEGDNRTAVVGDKPLKDFVKTWSQGDEGKHYVIAPANGGGNAPGSKANGSGKTLQRSAFDALSQIERATFAKEGGQVI